MAIEHTAALFYSWSIRYIVNRAPVTEILEGIPADDTSSLTTNDNILAIVTAVANDAWEPYKQRRK